MSYSTTQAVLSSLTSTAHFQYQRSGQVCLLSLVPSACLMHKETDNSLNLTC